MEACQETFKVQKDPLNFDSKKRFRKDNQKVTQKRFHTRYCLDGDNRIDDWGFAILGRCEKHELLKERKTFGNTDLKSFTQ